MIIMSDLSSSSCRAQLKNIKRRDGNVTGDGSCSGVLDKVR